MRSTIASSLLFSLVTGLPSQPRQSLLSSPVADVTSSSAPTSWTAQCGGRTYLGSYTVMMDWAECRDYCKYSPHADQLGHQLVFADILDSDTMECLRYNMNQQYQPGNGYAGHYWVGGYRGEDGQYMWDSGETFNYQDFVSNPGAKPYVHLTPGNNYQWNTKSDANDRDNGCLCRSLEPVEELEAVNQSNCEEGWLDLGDKCIILPPKVEDEKIDYYETGKLCQETYGGSMVEWSTYQEYVRLSILMSEHFVTHGNRRSFISAQRTEEVSGLGLWSWPDSGESAFLDGDMNYWAGPKDQGVHWGPQPWDTPGFTCALFQKGFGLGRLVNTKCDPTYPPMCQKMKV